MASEVEICNIALANIRAKGINSLTENSLQAQQCKLFYPILRNQLLEDAPWQFGHKVKPLSLLTLEAFSYGFVYQYPSDCLKVNKLILNHQGIRGSHSVPSHHSIRDHHFGTDTKIEYEIQIIDDTKVILADQDELRIDYRANITDPNLFTTQFIMTLGHLLASEIAVPIVGAEMGRQLRSDSFQIYNRYLNAAIASNSNERHARVPESEFITVQA